MIDWARVRTLKADIGEDEFAEIVDIFLEEMQETLKQLDAANTPELLEHTLHALKNGALNLGFETVSALCEAGERQAASGASAMIDLPAIRKAFDQTLARFLAEIGKETDQ